MGLLNTEPYVPNPYYGMSAIMPKMIPASYLAYLKAAMESKGALKMPNINPYPIPPQPKNYPMPKGLFGTVRG